MHDSVFFGTFTNLCNNRRYLISQYFHQLPKEIPGPVAGGTPAMASYCPPPGPAHSAPFMEMHPCSARPAVWLPHRARAFGVHLCRSRCPLGSLHFPAVSRRGCVRGQRARASGVGARPLHFAPRKLLRTGAPGRGMHNRRRKPESSRERSPRPSSALRPTPAPGSNWVFTRLGGVFSRPCSLRQPSPV